MMTNNNKIDQLLHDYLSGYIEVSEQCPVNNIEAYETGKFLKSSSNCDIECYQLAKRIMQLRKQTNDNSSS